MGNPNLTLRSPSLTLPLGCRFYPSEEQILCYYLPQKNSDAAENSSSTQCSSECFDAIKEINLYNFNPYDLPEVTCFRFGCKGRKKHWFFYTERINGEERERRGAGFGFWKRKGRVRDVLGGKGGEVVLGRRSCFVFCMKKQCDDDDDCKSRGAVKTDWIMYEYALLENLKASFVLCRVFMKSRGQKSVSNLALRSCAEESVGIVRHIGIQHDGNITSNEARAKEHECIDRNDPSACVSRRLHNESFQLSPIMPLSPVRLPRFVGLSTTLADMITAHESSYIVEGDYIELDDLI